MEDRYGPHRNHASHNCMRYLAMASVLLNPKKSERRTHQPRFKQSPTPHAWMRSYQTAAGVLETSPAEHAPVAVAHLQSYGNLPLENMWLSFVSIRCRARSPST
ncbi:hypothetical protein CABS01_04495 [Colletotrichum abscissum]|nr:uncharacterized protein CABS01_04495 [Colletotrichum abscissum]KAK1473833.1 hypothetical protein CABS01_04495 [Colletotrichum abscissum]